MARLAGKLSAIFTGGIGIGGSGGGGGGGFAVWEQVNGEVWGTNMGFVWGVD